ncbi:unnamed protein product [Camellia sinensis]
MAQNLCRRVGLRRTSGLRPRAGRPTSPSQSFNKKKQTNQQTGANQRNPQLSIHQSPILLHHRLSRDPNPKPTKTHFSELAQTRCQRLPQSPCSVQDAAAAGRIAGAFTYLQTKGASEIYDGSFDAIVKTFKNKGVLDFYSEAYDIGSVSQIQGVCNRKLDTTSVSEPLDCKESGLIQDGDTTSTRSRNSALAGNANQVEAEWIEKYGPGVYITLVAVGNGTRDLKRPEKVW